jgi:hypothetical protein
MNDSKVTVRRAARIADSMAGKISSPFCSGTIVLPSSSDGPSRFPITRSNCGSRTSYVCSMLWPTETDRLERLLTSSVVLELAKTARTTAAGLPIEPPYPGFTQTANGLIAVPSHQRFSAPSLKIAKCRWGVCGGAFPLVPT